MTLAKKILTASLPVALVGVVTPTIASCSCHKDSYTYAYKEHINCLDKNDGDYHKRKDIANAAKQKTYRELKKDIMLDTANSLLKNTLVGGQYAFNDLIASITIIDGADLNLKNWGEYNPTSLSVTCSLKYKEYNLESLTFEYVSGVNKEILLKISDNIKLRSYTFYDCTASE